MPNIPLHRSFIHVSWHNHLKISKNEGDYEGLNDFFKRKTTYNIGVYVRMRRSGDDVYRFVGWHIQSRGLVLSKWRTIFSTRRLEKNSPGLFRHKWRTCKRHSPTHPPQPSTPTAHAMEAKLKTQ